MNSATSYMIFSQLPMKIGAASDTVRMKTPAKDEEAAQPALRAMFVIADANVRS
jgi:hypothetical protein